MVKKNVEGVNESLDKGICTEPNETTFENIVLIRENNYLFIVDTETALFHPNNSTIITLFSTVNFGVSFFFFFFFYIVFFCVHSRCCVWES